MKIWERYTDEIANEKFDVIMIGSGMGGLTAAALLSRAGKRVLVLERHFKVGGFTHTFKRGKYEWDVGIHYIGQMGSKDSFLRKVFDDLSDGELQWAAMPDVYDRLIFPDRSYDLTAGKENYIAELTAAFPEEKNAILEHLKLVKLVHKGAQGFFANRAMPSLLSKLSYPFMSKKYLSLAGRTTADVLSDITSNQKLISVLTGQWGDYGLTPSQSSFAIHAAIVNHYMNGGYYPVGGARRIAETIVPVIRASGGKVLVRAGVEEIITEKNRAIGVRLENGAELKAPMIISNAGVHNTFGHLLKQEVLPRKKVDSVSASCGHICLYIGIDQPTKDLNLSGTNLWIYPDYDHDKNIARYLDDPMAPLPVTYLSFPSEKDPLWEEEHPGTTTMEAIGLAPYDWFADWENSRWKKRGADYETLKESLTERLLENLYKYVPQVKGKIDHMELSTPLSTRDFVGYERGEIYGLEHTPFRFRQRWLRPDTPVKNLYLTGQDIVTDGVTGAMMAGVLTTAAILKRNVIKDILARQQA